MTETTARPEWRDVRELRVALSVNAAASSPVNAQALLDMLDESGRLPRRAADRLTEQDGGPPNERYPDPTAAELRAAPAVPAEPDLLAALHASIRAARGETT